MDADLIKAYNRCAVDMGVCRTAEWADGAFNNFRGSFTTLFYISLQYRDLATFPGIPDISGETLSNQVSMWLRTKPSKRRGQVNEEGVMLFECFSLALRSLGLLSKCRSRHEVNHAN